MSGFTPLHITRFRDLLGARGYTMGRLRAEVVCSHRHFSQIIWGYFKGDGYWAKIRACVTEAEWAELLHGEHCATWNNAQLAAGPTADVWLMRVRCGWCDAELPFKRCERVSTGAEFVSHGICPTCYASKMAELDALRPVQAARDVTPQSFAPVRRTPRHRPPCFAEASQDKPAA